MEEIQVDPENEMTDKAIKTKQRINEYTKKWLKKKYEEPEFRAKVKLRYYKKKYEGDPMITSILEEDVSDCKKFSLIVQYIASKKM
jgi:tripartite-type tricarboxylate transporter receptor subunit TctC